MPFLIAAWFLLGVSAIPGLFGSSAAMATHGFSCGIQAFSGIFLMISGILGMGGSPGDWLPVNLAFIGECHFGIDVLSGIFLLILGIVTFATSLFSIGYYRHFQTRWNFHWLHPLTGIFIAALAGVFTARHVLGFLGMWELMALTSLGLVVFESLQEKQRRTGFIYLVITHVATAFLFLALLGPAMKSASGFSFDAWKQGMMLISPGMRNLILLGLIIGFGTKAGLVPFHVWLPRAHPQAPANISALMSGVMIKTGVYGILRFMAVPDLQVPAVWGWVLLALGFFSALLGVIYALNEHHLKILLAYSSVENAGIIFLGLGMAFLFKAYGKETESTLAFTAALFHAFNHALFKSLLFMGAGAIQSQTHTGNMNEFGGMVRFMPKTSILFFIGAAAISALPPTNGFASEWFIYRSLISGFTLPSLVCKIALPMLAAAMALTGALAAGCFVMAFGTVFLGKPRGLHACELHEPGRALLGGMFFPAFLSLLFGVFPDWVTNAISRFDGGSGLVFPASTPMIWMNNPQESFSPLVLLSLLVVGVLVGWLLFQSRNPKPLIEKADTWNCGTPLTERMSYSTSAFAEPFRVNFSMLFGLQRSLKPVPGNSGFFPKKWDYHLKTHKVFEEYLYKPILNLFVLISHQIQRIQAGSLHVYLLLMFLVVVILLATGL